MPDANVRRRGTGSPERCGGEIPIAYAIGLPDPEIPIAYAIGLPDPEIPIAYAIGLPEGHASQRTAAVAPCPLVPQNETSMPRFRATAAFSSAARSAPAASFA
jgi:hypothetical protein